MDTTLKLSMSLNLRMGDNFINVWYNGTMLNKENPYRFRFNVLPGTLFVPQEFDFDKSANMTLNLSEYANGNVSVIGVMDPDYQHEYVFARMFQYPEMPLCRYPLKNQETICFLLNMLTNSTEDTAFRLRYMFQMLMLVLRW